MKVLGEISMNQGTTPERVRADAWSASASLHGAPKRGYAHFAAEESVQSGGMGKRQKVAHGAPKRGYAHLVEDENSGSAAVSTEGRASKRQKVVTADRKAVDNEHQPEEPKSTRRTRDAEHSEPADKHTSKPKVLPFKPTTNKHGGSNALLLYNVPEYVSLQHLCSLFHKSAGITPCMLREPRLTDTEGCYKTMAFFKSAAHADLAFDTFEGVVSSEIYGLLRKPVCLGEAFNSDMVWLRKTNWPGLVERAAVPAEDCWAPSN
jgi:hypothetical protein